MEKTLNLIGKDIISAYECVNLGKCDSIYFNKLRKCHYIGLNLNDIEYVINVKDIIEYAYDIIMIKNRCTLHTYQSQELRLKNMQKIGFFKVVSLDGLNLGNISNISLTPSLYLNQITTSTDAIIDAKNIFNTANNTLIVKNNTINVTKSKYKPKTIFAKNTKLKDITVQIEKVNEQKKDTKMLPSISPSNNNNISDTNAIIGRTVSKNIIYINGEIIFKAGTKISYDTIKRARLLGKLFELIKYSK